MIPRTLKQTLKNHARKFPALSILGPRQSGKTTLARATFPHHTYVTLEEPDTRQLALDDPRHFLKSLDNEHGIILDEVQHVPALLSYIQTIVDTRNTPGYFVLTGSHNLLLNEAISQTLAGRISILTLLPLSLTELKQSAQLPQDLDHAVWHGMYPRLFDQKIPPHEWYPSYIQTYLERDVRQIKTITNLSTFQRFLGLCAGRIGQLLNLSSLANDCGISLPTARGWLSILEMSYIIVLLQPYYKNFNKRLVKTPKLYFYDTGIACSLLGIRSPQDLNFHYLRGSLAESFIISELHKQFYNRSIRSPLYFWRDNQGHEIDCLIDLATTLTPIEIKSGLTMNNSFFDGLSYWHKLTGTPLNAQYVVYGGTKNWQYPKGNVVSWGKTDTIVDSLLT